MMDKTSARAVVRLFLKLDSSLSRAIAHTSASEINNVRGKLRNEVAEVSEAVREVYVKLGSPVNTLSSSEKIETQQALLRAMRELRSAEDSLTGLQSTDNAESVNSKLMQVSRHIGSADRIFSRLYIETMPR